MVAAFAGTGVRRGELLRLRHGDVDLDGGVVTVTRLLRRFELTSEDEVLLERHLGSAAAVDGNAATTVVGRRSALRSLLAWLRADAANPATVVRPPKVTPPRIRIYAQKEAEAMLAELDLGRGRARVFGPHHPHRWRHTFATELHMRGVASAASRGRACEPGDHLAATSTSSTTTCVSRWAGSSMQGRGDRAQRLRAGASLVHTGSPAPTSASSPPSTRSGIPTGCTPTP